MTKEIKFDEKLTRSNKEAEERDAQRRAQKNNYPYINLSTRAINTEALALIPEETAQETKAAAIEIKENKIALAAYEPTSKAVQDLIKNLKTQGFKVTVLTVSLSGLNYALSFYKFIAQKAAKITGQVEIKNLPNNLAPLENLTRSLQKSKLSISETNQILEMILFGAILNRASDIHFEPLEKKVKLRLRIDGILYDVFEEISLKFYSALISRIKLLSNLKLNVHDEPQDGRFTIKFPLKAVEVRVAIAPSEFGEVAVARLLDPEALNIFLTELGLRPDDLEIIEAELKKPNGLILNTGPTGSGKTTTLYAFLKHKKSSEIKIITIEDPIEYHLEGIEQTQVNQEAGYTFANGLRSLMRQDPDVILVGEIRDKETADIGIQAALTGHLVFSTVHANSASGAIPRLLDLGVKASSIGPALNLIIAQRLVRRLCPQCKILQEPSADFKKKVEDFLNKLPKRIDLKKFQKIQVFKPGSCQACSNFGYKGRVAIYELLVISPALKELINKEASELEIEKLSLEQEMTTMQQDGILKVISGITTLEEIEAITGTIKL